MYKKFFQLKRNPFEISPDPYFLYPTEQHREALASLYYGIRERRGFVVLSGEVGTGKTMIVRCLLDKLSKQHINYAYVFNPRLTAREFLRYIVGDLGLPIKLRSKGELLLKLNQYLIDRHKLGQITVLIIDEAHLLRREVLEEVRLLTNLETSQDKLLQIALVGQPELNQLLDSTTLRQLKQRIALRCDLQPLSAEEVGGYIEWRLRLAGGNGKAPLFPAATLQSIHRYSTGIPRLINTICENALITAFSESSRTVTAAHVEEAARDLHLSEFETDSPPPSNEAPYTRTAPPSPHEFRGALEDLAELIESLKQTAADQVKHTVEKNS